MVDPGPLIETVEPSSYQGFPASWNRIELDNEQNGNKKKQEVSYPLFVIFLLFLPLRNQPDDDSYGNGDTGDQEPKGEQ